MSDDSSFPIWLIPIMTAIFLIGLSTKENPNIIQNFIDAVGLEGWWIIFGCLTILLVVYFLQTILEFEQISSKWKREEEATKIFDKRQKEFYARQDIEGFRRWKERNKIICDLNTSGRYY